MQSAVCNRCPLWAKCCLNYGSKACHNAAKEAGFEVKPTNFERIKDMSIEEMAAFLKSMVDDNETHEVGCYGCINYGTHHSDPRNKENGLYECEGCYCEGVGHDLVKWLEREVEQ